MNNTFGLEVEIELKSPLAHGAFTGGATIVPFRRMALHNRDAAVPRGDTRLALERAVWLAGYIWSQRSRNYQWTYQQLAERLTVASYMSTTLADFSQAALDLFHASAPLFGDNAQAYAEVVLGKLAPLTLAVFQHDGLRTAVVALLQASRQSDVSILMDTAAEQFHDLSSAVTHAPVYSGNAMRNGVIRRGAARFLLDTLETRVPLGSFRALFTGGGIAESAEKAINIREVQAFRELMPLYALLGGGFGTNRLLEGTLKCGFAYPLVREAGEMLPVRLREEAQKTSMREIMAVESATRREDAMLLASEYLSSDAPGVESVQNNSMLYQREVMTPGARLYAQHQFLQGTERQVGAYVSGWLDWHARGGFLGGIGQQGHGRADVIVRGRDGDMFLALRQGEEATLSDTARQALAQYQMHLRRNKSTIKDLLLRDSVAQPVSQEELERDEMD